MTLWCKPVVGDAVRSKKTGTVSIIRITGWTPHEMYWDDYEFVTVTPIEPPPEPLRRTVYVPVYKNEEMNKLSAGAPITNGLFGYAGTGEEAAKRTSGFEHRVGIIKVELVEGQFDD